MAVSTYLTSFARLLVENCVLYMSNGNEKVSKVGKTPSTFIAHNSYAAIYSLQRCIIDYTNKYFAMKSCIHSNGL